MQTHRSVLLLPADYFPHLHSAPSLVQLYATLSGWEMVMNKFRAFHWFMFVFSSRGEHSPNVKDRGGIKGAVSNLRFHKHEKLNSLPELVKINCGINSQSYLKRARSIQICTQGVPERLRDRVISRVMHVWSWQSLHTMTQTLRA